MEMGQAARATPIKEHDSAVERLEKENFELKLQINHLKLRLNEVASQTSLSVLPCDCNKTQEETQNILKEVKAAMETLIREKTHLEGASRRAKERIGELEEEKERLTEDCVKLSEHIAKQQKKEQESQEVLKELKKEIIQVQAESEEAEANRAQLKHAAESCQKLKEEYLRLEEFSKKIEWEYKREMEKNSEIQKESAELVKTVQRMQKEIEETRRYAGEAEKHGRLGEQVAKELKKEKQAAVEQRDAAERRAEEVIREREREREMESADAQELERKQRERAQGMHRTLRKMEAIFDEDSSRVAEVTSRIDRVFNGVAQLERLARQIIGEKNVESAKYAEKIAKSSYAVGSTQAEMRKAEEMLKRTSSELERTEKEKNALALEVEELRRRIRITPECARTAEELGINSFTTVNDLFVQMKEEKARIETDWSRKIEKIEEQNRAEKDARQRKLVEFQEKLQMAVSELNLCKSYLEEKKNLIKTLKKHQSGSLLKKIDVSPIGK